MLGRERSPGSPRRWVMESVQCTAWQDSTVVLVRQRQPSAFKPESIMDPRHSASTIRMQEKLPKARAVARSRLSGPHPSAGRWGGNKDASLRELPGASLRDGCEGHPMVQAHCRRSGSASHRCSGGLCPRDSCSLQSAESLLANSSPAGDDVSHSPCICVWSRGRFQSTECGQKRWAPSSQAHTLPPGGPPHPLPSVCPLNGDAQGDL